LREEKHGFAEGMRNSNFVEYVGILPCQICQDNVCGADAFEDILHDHIRSEDVIPALAVQVAMINKSRLYKFLIDHLQIGIAERHNHEAPSLLGGSLFGVADYNRFCGARLEEFDRCPNLSAKILHLGRVSHLSGPSGLLSFCRPRSLASDTPQQARERPLVVVSEVDPDQFR
jgi:hypothetical protein